MYDLWMGYIHCMFYQNCISIVHWRQVCEALYEVCILLYIQTNLPFLTSTHDSLSYPITPPVPTVQGGGGNSWHLSSPTSCTGGGGSWHLSFPTSCAGGEGGAPDISHPRPAVQGEGAHNVSPPKPFGVSYRYHIYLKSTNIYICE